MSEAEIDCSSSGFSMLRPTTADCDAAVRIAVSKLCMSNFVIEGRKKRRTGDVLNPLREVLQGERIRYIDAIDDDVQASHALVLKQKVVLRSSAIWDAVQRKVDSGKVRLLKCNESLQRS